MPRFGPEKAHSNREIKAETIQSSRTIFGGLLNFGTKFLQVLAGFGNSVQMMTPTSVPAWASPPPRTPPLCDDISLLGDPNYVNWDEEVGLEDLPQEPLFGGYFLDTSSGSDNLIPFVGSDLDAQTVSFSYDPVTEKWRAPSDQILPGYTKIKGPVHTGQYRAPGVKAERKTTELCTT